MDENFYYCQVVGKTDIGRKRSANEDNMYNAITKNGLVSIVCDGMGGHVGGATASKIAVSTIIDNLNNVYYDDPRIAIGESIDKANEAIIQNTIEHPELAGMGSTCVLLLVRGGKVYIGHVGDSRIYLIRSKKIVQLTKDHSYVQMLVDCGEITKEQADHHPRKNEITNALGIPNMSPATVADEAIIPEAGDCFVLCSDGLSGMVSDHDICRIISRQSEMNAQERVDRLVALANEYGGIDNITVQLVEFSVSPNFIFREKKFPVWAKVACVILLLLVLCIGGYFWFQPKPLPNSNEVVLIEDSVNTRSLLNLLGTVKFKKHEKFVEFVFNESSLKFIINNKEKLTRTENNVSLDPNSLEVKTYNISRDNSNSWLAFTDKYPGKSVEFSFTTFDRKEVYKYKIDIIQTEENEGLSIPSHAKGQSKEKGSKGYTEREHSIKEERTKNDTVNVSFEYDELVKETILLFNYSANPRIIFNKVHEESVASYMLDNIREGILYDNEDWSINRKEKERLLSFKFERNSSNKHYKFIIPCIVKNSSNQIVISVELIPKKSKSNDIPPQNIDKENNNTLLLRV